MSYKKKIRNIIIACLIAIVASLVLALPENFGLCSKGDTACVRKFIHRFDNIIQTTFYFALAIIFSLTGAYFTGEKAFNAWKKFARIYLPIAIVLVLISPTTNMNFVGFDKELTTMWLAGIFFVVSLGIIFGKKDHHSPLDLDEC
ncbi:MAG: hypothetical protein OEV93_00995 [Candidatus Moranbacteria bacterium]|nr:hypothetical protein [Candidatus Moranbacteria bacterium]